MLYFELQHCNNCNSAIAFLVSPRPKLKLPPSL